MVKIFKENRKMTLLGVFGIVFFAAVFWLVQPAPKAEAMSCSSGCDTSGGVCVWDYGMAWNNFLQGRQTCSVNAPYQNTWDLGGGWSTFCSTGSGASTKICQTGTCPSFNDANGSPCTIVTPTGTLGISCSSLNSLGKWDASESKCIACSGNKELSVCGTTESITVDTNTGACIGASNGKFESACDSTIATQCDDKNPGDNCGGTNICDSGGNCVTPVVSALTVSANPATVTQGTAAPITFTVTDGTSAVNGATVSITNAGTTGMGTSGTCTAAVSSNQCFFSVTATSTGTATATASKTGYTSGTTTITVQAAPACPKGSGAAGSGTSFAVGFTQLQFTTSETFKISYMIPPEEEDGAICIYAPGASTSSYTKSGTSNEHSTAVPQTSSNYDTNYKPTSAGDWKATISKSSSCSASSTCSATTTVTAAASACNNNGIKEGTEQCDGLNLGSKNCSTIGMGFTGGLLSCKPDCTFDTSACTTSGGPASLIITASPSTITVNSPTTITFTVTDGTSAVNGATVSITNAGTTGMGTSGTCTAAVSSNQCFFSVTATSTGTATATASKTGFTPGSTTINVAGVAPSAGPCASGTTNYRSPLSYCSIQELIQGATGWVLGLVSSIIILFLVYGGIMYTMAAGDETKMESAKNIIYYAILGLAIILVSYTLITEVKTILKIP